MHRPTKDKALELDCIFIVSSLQVTLQNTGLSRRGSWDKPSLLDNQATKFHDLLPLPEQAEYLRPGEILVQMPSSEYQHHGYYQQRNLDRIFNCFEHSVFPL